MAGRSHSLSWPVEIKEGKGRLDTLNRCGEHERHPTRTETLVGILPPEKQNLFLSAFKNISWRGTELWVSWSHSQYPGFLETGCGLHVPVRQKDALRTFRQLHPHDILGLVPKPSVVLTSHPWYRQKVSCLYTLCVQIVVFFSYDRMSWRKSLWFLFKKLCCFSIFVFTKVDLSFLLYFFAPFSKKFFRRHQKVFV